MDVKDRLKKVSLAGLIITLGIIYGDIGTSPLYVVRSIVGDRPITEELVYGGISCVFWTLTLQTTFKYIILTLQADNNGEGGIFSLYALIRRYKKWFYFPAILGAATLLADGIITPPISVSSAIEGLNGVRGFQNIIVPGNNLTVGIIIGILSLLFFFQQFGTKVVGSAFGPMMFIWFLMIMILGINQIAHFPPVLAAFNPYYGIHLLFHYPKGFWLLGAVFLCTTGAEALYSDLGHCGRKNIRVSWMFVKTALVANYFGQGAWLLHSGKSYLNDLNPFYEIMPHWFLLAGIVIATAAAIIASQALISGSYTLISEAVSLNFWPRITIKYPTDIRGQIYIPSINWLLWFGCMLMMLYFRDSAKMEAAYGFSITVAMLMTTLLMYHYMKYVKKWPMILIILILLVFLSVELSFFIANVAKIKERWKFLIFEFGIFFVMFVWYKARKITNRFLQFESLNNSLNKLVQLSNATLVPKYATHLVYLTKANNKNHIEQRIIDSILSNQPKRADVYWFVHIDRMDDPYTLEYSYEALVPNKIMRIDFKLGFRINPKISLYFKKVLKELIARKELNIPITDEIAKRYNLDINGDIKYVIIRRFLSVENEFTFRESFILNSYFFINKWALSDKRAFGLDINNAEIELTPLLVSPPHELNLKRLQPV